MTQPQSKTSSTGMLLIATAIIAILTGGIVGLSVGYTVHYAVPTTRYFDLFDSTLPFNESQFGGKSHDIFVPDRITVNKGDTVVIRYVNIEDVAEHHTFTMDPPYTFNAVIYANRTQGGGLLSSPTHTSNIILDQGQNATITFTASWAGVFRYYCSIHLPTMTGYLVVIG